MIDHSDASSWQFPHSSVASGYFALMTYVHEEGLKQASLCSMVARFLAMLLVGSSSSVQPSSISEYHFEVMHDA
jgi:hypothetical protein